MRAEYHHLSQPVSEFQSVGLSTTGGTASDGDGETGFGTSVVLVGAVVQASSNNSEARANKANWFFIAFWLKWHLINIQQP